MNFGYAERLVCLSLASFFLVSAALSLLVSLWATAAIRTAERMNPRSGARLLLALRLMPLLCALVVVGSLSVPSYLWLEPDIANERAGAGPVALAVLGLILCGYSLWRSGRAVAKSRRFVRECLASSEPLRLTRWDAEAFLIESTGPVLLLAGIFRPRLIVSGRLLKVLDAGSLAVALRHERAHRDFRDNLKSFAVLLAPDLFPLLSGFRRMEASRARLTEWAADDRAVAGSPADSVSLADALVCCARLGTRPAVPSMTASLLCCDQDLSVRVDRLLEARRPDESARTVLAIALLLGGLVVTVLLQPWVLPVVHRAFEFLMG
jgi:hypothetical protein